MINPTGKKLEKLLFGMFDDAIQGVDRYNYNGNLWLIFTDELRWVVEYTKTQTLWYNFYFFKQEMEIIGLDCVDNKDLIQKWFESRFLNINPVEYTRAESFHFNRQVEDTIQNGVKHIKSNVHPYPKEVEDTIQNGVKGSTSLSASRKPQVEQTIQNGVKNTYADKIPHEYDWSDQFTEEIEDTIQNGVKNTENLKHERIYSVDDTIQNGVKETTPSGYLGSIEMKGKLVHQIESPKQNNEVEDIIQNGVKEIRNICFLNKIIIEEPIKYGVKETCESESTRSISLRLAIQNGVKHCEDGDWLDGDERFEDITKNGVKEMQPLPAQDGNRDWGKYYHGKEDRTKPHTEYVKDVIKNGLKDC